MMNTFLTVLATLAAVGLFVLAWLGYRRKASVTATVKRHLYQEPGTPDVPGFLRSFLEHAAYDDLELPDGTPPEAYKAFTDHVSKVISETIPPSQLWELAPSGGELLEIDIENRGGDTAEDLEIHLPYGCTQAQLNRKGETTTETRDIQGDAIIVGDLRPSESVNLLIWRRSGFHDDVGVVQRTGKVRVDVYRQMGPVWQWLDRNWAPLATVLVMLLVFAALLGMLARQQGSERSPASDLPDSTRVEEVEEVSTNGWATPRHQKSVKVGSVMMNSIEVSA